MIEENSGRLMILPDAKQILDTFQKDPDIGHNVCGMRLKGGKLVILLKEAINKQEENWEKKYPSHVVGIEHTIEYAVLPPKQ